MRWLRFGTWPSSHDLDLMLDADDYEFLGEMCPYPDDVQEAALAPPHILTRPTVPLPDRLVEQAVNTARGLPLDLFLFPVPAGFSLKAWVPPPYDRWEVHWAMTNKAFFVDAMPLEETPS